MPKILGLDLGTNSIGWALIDSENDENQIEAKGVRIFSEGVKIEKGIESSKAAERTGFRAARRMKFRRKLRKYQTLKVLIQNNMCPLSFEELELWKQKKIYPKNEEFINWLKTHEDKNPYYFRAKAAGEKLINPLQLGRAMYHLAQRRGFKSNRLEAPDDDSQIEDYKTAIEHILEDSETVSELNLNLDEYLKEVETDDKKTKSLLSSIRKLLSYLQKTPGLKIEEEKPKFYNILNKKENLGKVKQNIVDLSDKIKEADCTTLGQYFYTLYQKAEKIRSNYTSREEHYEHEFNIICDIQKINPDLKELLRKAIFFQRPLRSQKGLIGKCTFEPDKPRCPVSHPLYEEYRMHAFINTVKFKRNIGNQFEPLTKEMREEIIPLFYRKSKKQFDFKEIAAKIAGKKHKHAYYKDKKAVALNPDILFNFSYTTSVSGNPVCAHLKEILGDDWKTRQINYSYQYKNDTKTAKADYQDLWHVLFTYEDDKNLKEFASDKLKLESKLVSSFIRTPIKQGYAALSLKAIKKILPYLEKGVLFTHSVFLANIPEVVGKEVWNDEKQKNEITQGITDIIDRHETENKRLFAINSLLKNEFDNNSQFSKESEAIYQKDIEKQLKKEFGNTWSMFENPETVIENSFTEFIDLLKARKFAKIKRIDEKIKDFLTGQNDTGEIYCSIPENFKKLFHPSDVEVYKEAKVSPDGKRYLGSPVLDAVKNPVAMKTLHQLRHLINSLIHEGKIDEATQIHIELARDLNDANQRSAIKTWQNRQKADRENAVKRIMEHIPGIEPSEHEILKYLLWEEQKHKCLYTGNEIGISDFIGAGPKYEIEHTIPRSLSYDNSRENNTLCEKEYNDKIKGQKIPYDCPNYEDILKRIESWETTIKDLNDKIDFARKNSQTATTKEAKDKAIQRKHVLSFEKDYWYNKQKRFLLKEVPEGFKNSQLNDTRLMTKYARAFMKTVFPKVFVVKGSATAEFRKIWGIQPEYETKQRVNHIHHAIDAVVIACMTKPKYDLLAKYYQDKESENRNELDRTIAKLKPWKTFTQDVKGIADDTLIYHVSEDNAIKPAKKKLRKRGAIQYKKDRNGNYILDKDGKKQIILLQGDSIRGSLHKDTVYGAIQDKDYISKPEDTEVPVKYVVRKKVEDLSAAEIEKIVDDAVREKISLLVKEEGIAVLKKEIWMNKEKGIRIKKVRIYSPSVTKPIHLKKHRDLSKHEYKQHIHVTNDENYVMAIYEDFVKDKLIRKFELINLLDAAQYYKVSNTDFRSENQLIPELIKYKNNDLPLRAKLLKGSIVLFYKDSPEEIEDMIQFKDNKGLAKRLYKITSFEPDGRIQFKLHNEARPDTQNDEGRKSIVDFENPHSRLRLSLSGINFLIEGKDFKLTDWGEIIKI